VRYGRLVADAAGSSSLAAAIGRCAELCGSTLEAMTVDEAKDNRGTMLLAIAALETAADATPEGDEYELRLMIAATVARDTAVMLECYPRLDVARECAHECEEIAARCERAARHVERNGDS
jgi:hypothetical protein